MPISTDYTGEPGKLIEAGFRANTQPTKTSRAHQSSNVFYCKASISGVKLSMLVDSGSEYTILHHDVWKEMAAKERLSLQPFEIPLKTVSGQAMNIWGRVELPIILAGRVFRHSVLIGEIDSKGIMGGDFLLAHKACLEVWRQYFSLEGHVVPIFKDSCG